MIRRRLWISLVGIVTVAIVLLAANLLADNRPVLGLDLQGGVSVVLSTEEGATAGDLMVIRDLIRDELEGRGIAEPDVRVEGRNVLVDLPGVRDQREALEAVDVSGIVQLRPVVSPCQPPLEETTATSVPSEDSAPPDSSVATATTEAATTSDPGATSEPAATTATSASGEAPGTTASGVTLQEPESSTSGPVGLRRPAATDTSAPATSSPDTSGPDGSVPVTSEPDDSAADATTDDSAVASSEPPASSTPETSTPETSEPGPTTTTEPPLGPLGPVPTFPPTPYGPPPPPTDDQTIELPDRDGNVCTVGPVERGPAGESGGELFARGSAAAELLPDQGWIVRVDLTGDGRTTFNQLATACFTQAENCPFGALAIVLDDVVQSAPAVQAATFEDTITISGEGVNAFDESEARSLARVLDRGAFPVQVRTESVQTVSPTLGEDSLRASVFAGLAGVVLVLLGLLYFYRRLIVVVIAGLAVWAMLIYSISAIISQTTNYALTLAGVTGIIISIGVTVDSYVVYFERLKEEVRHGRTIRNSALRSFRATWRTILAANLVALIASAVLFGLSVGSVRGFALYLGITTACDLVVCWFFTRPATILLADTGWLDRGDTFGLKDYE